METTQSLSAAVASGQDFYKNGKQYVILQGDENKVLSTPAVVIVPENETGKVDDLTELKGIGAATAEKLESAGIVTFAQLANLDTDSQTALNTELNLIGNKVQKWVELAKEVTL